MELSLPLYGLVLSHEFRTGKNNKSFWSCMLKTVYGDIKCFMWGVTHEDPKYPHKGDILVVSKLDNRLEEYGNVVLDLYSKIKKDAIPKEYQSICEIETATPEQLKEASHIISDSTIWDNPLAYKFTMDCLKKVDKKKLITCPAASQVHHTYSGGLLIHTAEVLNIAKAIISTMGRYSFISKDVVYSASILHDLGKVFTYDTDELGISNQLTNEYSIGHIFYAMNIVQTSAEGSGLTKEFIDEILHCIASHHGANLEWGSYKKPQSIEATILSNADYISSRNGMIEGMLKETIKSKVPLNDKFKVYGDNYFASIAMKDYIKLNGN